MSSTRPMDPRTSSSWRWSVSYILGARSPDGGSYYDDLRARFSLRRTRGHQLRHQLHERRDCERLVEIGRGPRLERPAPVRRRSKGGGDDDRWRRGGRARRAHDIEAIAVGEPQISDDEDQTLGLEDVQGVTPRSGRDDPVAHALEETLIGRGQVGLVVNDQDGGGHFQDADQPRTVRTGQDALATTRRATLPRMIVARAPRP